MKSRLAVVIIFVVVVLVGGAVYGKHRFFASAPPAGSEQGTGRGVDREEAFLQQARELAAKNPQAKGQETGLLPPVTKDASLVPSISVEPAVLDLGVVAREGTATGEIKVANKGKATLEISQVSTSCGCTKATIDDPNKKSVPPGGATVVAVSVDPKRIPGFESTKTVTITSNDPQSPRTNVQVVAKIDPEFQLEPTELVLGEIPKGTPVEKTIVFRQLTQEPIEILELRNTSSGSGMGLSFVKRPPAEWASPDHPEYLITVRLPEDVTPGPFTGTFQIQTTCKRLHSFSYPPVRAHITAFYDITPRQLGVRGQPGQPGTASATIKADRPFEIADLQATGKDLVVASKPGPQPNSAILEVMLSPDAEPGSRNETVSFTIKAGDQSLKDRVLVRMLSMRPASALRPARAPAPVNSPAASGSEQKTLDAAKPVVQQTR